MQQAERIRNFVLERYIIPARNRGMDQIEVRAGDVHREMGLANAMPAVCSVLGSNKFEHYSSLKTIARSGPSNGSNARFRFAISPQPPDATLEPERMVVDTSPSFDFANATVLVSCVKLKVPHKVAARDLYTSPLFKGARSVAEGTGTRWYILSALYGLVEPQAVIAPYDFTLNSLGVKERRGWADKVFDALTLKEPDLRRVIMLAGYRYREFLAPKLTLQGIRVEAPMAHLRQGEQLAWLADRR